jgi:hypothetical protein
MMTNHTQVALRILYGPGFDAVFAENIAKICKVNSSHEPPQHYCDYCCLGFPARSGDPDNIVPEWLAFGWFASV